MIRHRNAERPRVLERGPHQMTGCDRSAVVGDRHGAGADHLPELREPFSFLADRHGADRMYARESGPTRLAHDEPDGRLVVGHRIGIRHRADGRESACRGRARAARHRLFVFVARLAQVHMQIHETRRHHLALHVAHEGAFGRPQPAAHARDLAVLNQHVRGLVHVATRVDHVPTLEQDWLSHSPPPRFAASASSARPPASR